MPEKDPSLMVRCLECDSRIYFERKPDLGQIIVCPECNTSLEVIRTSPIKLGWPDDAGAGNSAGGGVDLNEFFNALAEEEVEHDDYGFDDDDDSDY